MKRRNPNPNYESEGDCTGSVSDDNKRLQQRRRPIGSDDAVNANRINGYDVVLTVAGNGQGPTTSIHSLENIGENVYLPTYVIEHNSTLTFPEKVRFHCHFYM